MVASSARPAEPPATAVERTSDCRSRLCRPSAANSLFSGGLWRNNLPFSHRPLIQARRKRRRRRKNATVHLCGRLCCNRHGAWSGRRLKRHIERVGRRAGTGDCARRRCAERRQVPTRQSRVLRRRGGPEPVGARRTRDLVQGHGGQCPLPYVRLPAARQRADRLVSGAQCEASVATASRPGESSTIRVAAFRAAKDCPAKSLEETYGFDWCPGDDELLKFVGQPGYRDPACDFKDAPLDASNPHFKVEGPAAVGVRSGVRDFDRSARLSQVSEPAFR